MAVGIRSDRPMSVTTPLGTDALLLLGLSGREAISEPFDFQLDLVAANETQVPFESLLGQPVTVSLALPAGGIRYFSGIVSRFGQGARGPRYTSYRAEVVPELWLLTRKQTSRIFQQLSVPDILARVLAGLDVDVQLRGTFEPRNYCVQYRETDFAFVSRLMEEEGIFYYFEHAAGGHRLVLANAPGSPNVPGAAAIVYDPTALRRPGSGVVFRWEADQELRSGLVTLRDTSFELPGDTLEARAAIQDSVLLGTVTHQLKLPVNQGLELYDYPGGYAKRFDGIDPGGGEQPGELDKVLPDGRRTVEIRMEEEAVPSLQVAGAATAAQMTAGYTFQLEQHFNASGPYVLTSVEHSASAPNINTNQLTYTNQFECIPAALPYRPPRATPKPVVGGTQTAVVVGPAGEGIFVDKHGRVKVQFYWDREGKKNENSSCWIRVAQPPTSAAGGSIFYPRVGQEVVVAFEEGDPDRPLILGVVYDAAQLPPPPPPPQP